MASPRPLALVAACAPLGALAAAALAQAVEAVGVPPEVEVWAAMLVGAAVATACLAMRAEDVARDALLLAAAGAWTGAGLVGGGHPVPPVLGLLASLVVVAASHRMPHRAVGLTVTVLSCLAAAAAVPRELAWVRPHAALVPMWAALVTVGIVDASSRLRTVASLLALATATGTLVASAWLSLVEATLPHASLLAVSAASCVAAAVAVRGALGRRLHKPLQH
ncbi:MAG TPA: hypothetical protein VFH47_00130 [Candidatus Thermoplasmatota archaeon]|nr:hypothetical protein [Candidatus Thermoplasmatota archaeon]